MRPVLTVPVMQHKFGTSAPAGISISRRLQRVVRHGATVLDAALYETDWAELMEIELIFGRARSASDRAILGAIFGASLLPIVVRA